MGEYRAIGYGIGYSIFLLGILMTFIPMYGAIPGATSFGFAFVLGYPMYIACKA